jgi:TRAP-type mannitol/chloroaromatic compound transport system permease large subunit
MAETLLIVFVIFVVLGMPISIALGVGALAAASLYPALNPIIIPTRFVGLLSDSFLLLSAPLFILAGNIAARGGVIGPSLVGVARRPRHVRSSTA